MRWLLDDSDSQTYKSDAFSDRVPDTEKSRNYFKDNVDEVINKLNSIIGFDKVDSCHLQFAGDSIRSEIPRLFSRFLRHNYLPEAILNGQIKPFLKDNKISWGIIFYLPTYKELICAG